MALNSQQDLQKMSELSSTAGSDLASNSNQCDVHAITQLVDGTGQALALLDPMSDYILWHSVAWSKALPDLTGRYCWTDELKNNAVVAQMYRQYIECGFSRGPLLCDGTQQTKELKIDRLDSGSIALQLLDRHEASDDMHSYMQARESMFTTSRTISVSEMATTLAHEIKQPIATITNILKAVRIRLKRGDIQPVQLEEALENALEQAQFTNSVITRIRDFTQSRRPQQQIIDVAGLTREVLSLMDWFLSANQCRTNLVISDDLLLCQGDPIMLQQVLVNLLRNGVEAMHERDPLDRVLIIDCKRHASSARISIRDYGHGLKGKEKSLFVPFSTSKANGMGVGLNICRSFVELHQGRLWLSPNSEGGCTSTMELPLAKDE